MGPNESKMANGMYGNYEDQGIGAGNSDIKNDRSSNSQSMISKFMNFGFGTTGNQNVQPQVVDLTITGEGTQPLADLNWKKKENKFQGSSSITDREAKELKEIDKRNQTDQYLYKFPDNEKYMGFENVSVYL